MKLASLKEGGRDGTLVVVSRDLTRAARAANVAPTLQAALDSWRETEPELRSVHRLLEEGLLADVFALDPAALAAPLPRAYQWADGSAYLSHAERLHEARGSKLPERLRREPLMYQGGSDGFLAPQDAIAVADEAWGIDFEAELAVITDDVPMGTAEAEAGAHIRLIMLANDVSLRTLIPDELEKGFGFFQGKPATAFSPVAATPDELGSAWDGGTVALPMVSHLNGTLFGRPHAGTDMAFAFPALIAHAARTRALAAGSIIGSGTISNQDWDAGCACLAERRMIETIVEGEPKTPFLRFGDRVRIEMLDAEGLSVFGAIDQEVIRYPGPS